MLEVLRAATALVGGADAPREHVVGRLTPQEQQTLVDTFRSLLRLSADERNGWLVGRPGLVDLLLRVGRVVESSDLLSEADVFVAVWNGLVRNHEERTPNGTSPDDREQAVLAAAGRLLDHHDTASPGGAVRAELRSDGVLQSPANPALAPGGDEFATDLIRDLALCRFFLARGWQPLRDADAPRWAIRAARLACQVRLLDPDQATAWGALRRVFDDLGDAQGQRWSEIPFEALLTLWDAKTAIEKVWETLVSEDFAGLTTLLRLAKLRYVKGTVGDRYVLAPVVAVTYASAHDLGRDAEPYARRGLTATMHELVLAWLRGLATGPAGPDPLRQQVRDRILDAEPDDTDEFAVEALAMLGADLDDRTEQWLRTVAVDWPHRLQPAIESFGVAMSMSAVRPQLLLDLTEAYYIERADSDYARYGVHALSDGIRDDRHGHNIGHPFAGWYFGPFFGLLDRLPAPTIAMINRMLDHAATNRVRSLTASGGAAGTVPDTGVAGLDLDVAGLGPRHYVGDGHVWAWYRGSGVGPYPCMSALLAIERFADLLINREAPLKAVVQWLLRDSHSLAMPGLVVGLLVRHLNRAEDQLDEWLTQPSVWHLEFGRATQEGLHHAQVPDADDVIGRDRRRLTPRDVAAEMTIRAVAAGDQARLNVLSTVGDHLLAAARAAEPDGPEREENLAAVEVWAAGFRPDNYRTQPMPDGSVAVEYQAPEPVAAVLARSAAELDAGNEALRLQITYGARTNPADWPTDALAADIAVAQHLAADPPESIAVRAADSVAAVAAAALVSHTRQLATVSEADLQWAADTLLTAAAEPTVGRFDAESTIYPMAADRAAARALPSLLLPVLHHVDVDRTRLTGALTSLAVSMFDEVRRTFAAGCVPVWGAPCIDDDVSPTGCERHAPLWTAVQTGLSDCRLGPWNPQTQSREVLPLTAPYAESLALVPTTDLLVDRLSTPIACATAARSAACTQPQASALLPVMLQGHCRGFDHWMTEGYAGYEEDQRALVARALITLTVEGEPEHLVTHLQTFASNANALHTVLDDLARVFTYDDQARADLPVVWPLVLRTVLDAVDAGADLLGNRHWVDYALGALLPTPQARPADPDFDGTLRRARADWLAPAALDGLVDRWIALAVGEPDAADAVASFARTASHDWQATEGLTWLESIIDNRYDRFAGRCWFVVSWLAE
ncbi:hypothetical protein, partial [Kutzneria sp. 744]|uniref:hypothetical protein n=1 Tax=Kutzneria sp. (strain 744) TaxID=345341 RepID=UPI0018DC7AB9